MPLIICLIKYILIIFFIFRTPIKAGRVICEVGGKVYWEEVNPWLKRFAANLPFEAIAVNTEILQKLNDEEERLKEANTNPVKSMRIKFGISWLGRIIPKSSLYCNEKIGLSVENLITVY
jgi:hypothetical protein